MVSSSAGARCGLRVRGFSHTSAPLRVDYTPAVVVSRAVTDNLAKASWIRRMFEEGARLKRERGPDKVFDFTLGNPEVEPPPAVLAAARRVLARDAPHLHAYMPNAGYPEVRAAVARQVSAATGLAYTANHVLMTVGAGAALNTVLKALLDPGDEVLTVAPFFAEYVFYAENHGGRLVVVPPTPDLTPDVDRLAAAITPRTRAVLVNSPNNPSGVIYPASVFVEIEAALARAPRPIVLVSDEPYRALVFDDVAPPAVPPLVTRSVIATSWSKSLAIPGERIGYLAISPRMPEAAELFEACTFTSRVLGFVNAPALWQWVVAEVGDQVIDVGPYREKRDLMYEGLRRIGYQCVKPQGAFYVFPRTPIDDDVAFVRLLAEEGVLTVPGSGFGMPGHIRISLTVERDTVVRALPGFERAFRKARP
jgi:aspartate aminotransferase